MSERQFQIISGQVNMQFQAFLHERQREHTAAIAECVDTHDVPRLEIGFEAQPSTAYPCCLAQHNKFLITEYDGHLSS